jgi:hypothetical protein
MARLWASIFIHHFISLFMGEEMGLTIEGTQHINGMMLGFFLPIFSTYCMGWLHITLYTKSCHSVVVFTALKN